MHFYQSVLSAQMHVQTLYGEVLLLSQLEASLVSYLTLENVAASAR